MPPSRLDFFPFNSKGVRTKSVSFIGKQGVDEWSRCNDHGCPFKYRDQNHEQLPTNPPATSCQKPRPGACRRGTRRFIPGAGQPADSPGGGGAITTQEEFEALIGRLRAAGSFAYDSEFIGELTYLPKLCLIQVATTQEISLIDPIAKIDLLEFWELVADPAVEKITHAGQQDLEPVIRHLNRPGQNVFDTQISAGFVGMAYPVSLSKLVREVIGARLEKGLTFSHWDQRPLSGSK